jgi:two-component system sensor histidine kinase VanS
VLRVENTGETLTPQLVSTLVEPFQRGNERIRTDHAGVGLGLAIVRSITQAHDGTLTLTPRAAGGLCVTVQLPVVRTATEQAGPRLEERSTRELTPTASLITQDADAAL